MEVFELESRNIPVRESKIRKIKVGPVLNLHIVTPPLQPHLITHHIRMVNSIPRTSPEQDILPSIHNHPHNKKTTLWILPILDVVLDLDVLPELEGEIYRHVRELRPLMIVV